MGYYQKKDSGNYMGEPDSKDAEKGRKKNPVDGSKSFKKGSVLGGLPSRDANFPKAGRGPDWKDLRESDISKGSI